MLMETFSIRRLARAASTVGRGARGAHFTRGRGARGAGLPPRAPLPALGIAVQAAYSSSQDNDTPVAIQKGNSSLSLYNCTAS
jgi:hypothetical protein